jgi:transcriptional regulator with XRE-family HTH domain
MKPAGAREAKLYSIANVRVGNKLRRRRAALGMSQGNLAKTIGVSFQQIEKYERGTDRISEFRLHRLAKALAVPVSFFFEEMRSSPQRNGDNILRARGESDDLFRYRETLELVRAYYSIDNKKMRQRIRGLIAEVASWST